MLKLSDKIIADYPDNILRQFIKCGQEKLRRENQYNIVIGIHVGAICDKLNQSTDRSIHKLFIQFIIEILDLYDFEIGIGDKTNTLLFFCIRRMKFKMRDENILNQWLLDINGINTFKKYLSWLLNKIDSYPNDIFNQIYSVSVIDIIGIRLKFGFNIEESLKICQCFNKFDFGDTKILEEKLVNEGDYLIIKRHLNGPHYRIRGGYGVIKYRVSRRQNRYMRKIYQVVPASHLDNDLKDSKNNLIKSLSDLSIHQMISDWPNLRSFIQNAENKLKETNTYTIVLGIDAFKMWGIFKENLINTDDLKLFIKFILELIKIPDIHNPNLGLLEKSNNCLLEISRKYMTEQLEWELETRNIETWNDYLLWFLDHIDGYDKDTLNKIYLYTVIYPIQSGFRFAFSVKESIELYNCAKDFFKEYHINEIIISSVFKTALVKEGQYVMCQKHFSSFEHQMTLSYEIGDQINLKYYQNIDDWMVTKIYQVKP